MCQMLGLERDHGGRGHSPASRTASLRTRDERPNGRNAKAGRQAAAAGSGGRFLASRARRLASCVFPGTQDLAEHVKIATQHRKLNVSRKTWLRPVTTTLQPVACLQRADCRFDARMPLPRLTELNGRLPCLFSCLMVPGHGQARVGNDLGQLALVFRRMKTAVEGSLADASFQALLQGPRLFDHHVPIVSIARQQVSLTDETGTIFKDQHLASELDRLTGLSSLVQLGMRLEDAEQLVLVGNFLVLKHPTTGRAADVTRSFQKTLQFGIQGENLGIGGRTSRHPFSQLFRRLVIVSARSSSSRYGRFSRCW